MAYLALTGGIGGTKLGLGLARVLRPDALSFLVNTGDDFEHLGLHVSPDVDTLTYTLAGASNTALGWGRKDETWRFMAALEALGGETWFRLGDADLALHVTRTQMLKQGATLTEAIRALSARLGVAHSIIPMSDDPVRTLVHTADGRLSFQHYFVRDRCRPQVTSFEFAGAADAAPSPALLELLPTCDGVIICPSNPYVSIDPILSVPGLAAALKACGAPIVAVSPIVGAAAIKGPTAKMMAELGVPTTAEQVAEHYRGLIDGFILDVADADLHGALGVPTRVRHSVMVTLEDRERLAAGALEFIKELSADLRPTAPLTIDDADDQGNCAQ